MSPSDPSRDEGGGERRRFPLRLALVCAAAVAVSLAVLALAKMPAATVEAGGRATSAVLDKAAQVAAAFRSERIETTYREHLVRIAPAGELEVALIETDETFARSDDQRILWDTLSLGRTTTEIRAPAVFRYHVSAEARAWSLALSAGTLRVTAPPPRPTLPVAFRSDGLEEHVHAGWARFDAAEQLEALRRQITPTLDERAGDPAHLGAAREVARRRIAEIVRGWLLGGGQWQPGRVGAIVVRFADEPEAAGAAPLLTAG